MPTDQNDEALPEDANIAQVRQALDRERDRTRAARAEAAEAEQLRREVAFLRAGVDADSPLGQVFQKGYDGELDVEAIKTAWSAIAPAATPPPSSETPPPPEATPTNDAQGLTPEQQAQLARDRANLSDTTPPGGEPQTPLGRDIMNAAFETQGGVRARPPSGMNDRALNAGFSRLFARANEDDPQAIFKRPNETWADATDRWRQSQS